MIPDSALLLPTLQLFCPFPPVFWSAFSFALLLLVDTPLLFFFPSVDENELAKWPALLCD